LKKPIEERIKHAILTITAILILSLGAPIAHGKERKPNVIEQWLFELAMKAAPPKYAWRPPSGPHAKETPRQREARYRDIAYDIYRVTFHQGNKPIPGMSRLHTAGFLLGMAVGESGLAPDADLGPCYLKGMRGRRCDGGRAVGILQVWIAPHMQDLYWGNKGKNRWKLITKGLKQIGGSIGLCHKLPVQERLAAYGAGTCESEVGQRVSRKRWKLISRILSCAKPPTKKSIKGLLIKARPPKRRS